MRFSDFLLVGDPGDLDFIVGYTEDENIRISVSDFFGNQIDGSGNPGYIPVFTSTQVLGNSQIFQDGANIVIGGVNAMGYRLAVGGSLYAANGAVIESSILGSNTFRAIGEEGNSFIIPHDLDESIFTPRTIIHAPAVLTTQSATLGQVNTAISTLEGDIDILLDLKVDESSVGAPNGVASLDSGGKVPLSEIPDSIIGQVQYMGTWNAFTNTPTLNPLVPEEKGHYYVVSAAGVFGGVDYQVGDWIISNGVIWEKVDNTDAVTSVFGRIGAILALEGDYQAFYPRLSQTYDNPTWINTLAFTKITGVPAFLLENQTITLSGDVTGSGKTSIASTISNNAVTDSKLRDSVGTSVIGRSASTTGDPADIQATTDGHVLLRSAGNLLFGLISGDSISSIDWSKITGTPTTLSGYGITNAYTKTESDNKFVPYTGASANVNLGSNNITANSFIKAGGTSSQFLKADGSVDTSQYVPTTRSVNAGTGLTGGGNLSSDITIAFDTAYGDNRYAYRTRQITINGVTFDLSADRTYNVGTVTSVGLSAPTGFSVSNSPVTTSGTLSLSFATGYSLPTSASQITWDTAYNNSIVSASVTGTETKLLTLTQQDGGTITASWSDFDTAPVTSVFGRIGDIIAQSGDYTTTLVTEGTNLYFTDSRARQSISLTTTGTNGPATYSNVTGVFNIPNYSTDLTGYVPYVGATQDLNLGTYGLLGDFIQFNLAPTSLPTAQGTMYWDADKETIDVILNGTTGSIFQDTFFFVKNQTGVTIPKGTVVRANGTVGASGRILIAPFLADGTFDSKFCLGVTTEEILDGADGRVTYFGAIRKVDTSAYTEGTVLYASPTVAGGFTDVEPTGPTNNIISVAIVIYSDNNNGEVFVRPTFIDSANDIAQSLGYTPANAATTITINGTTYDLSANRSWSVGTVDTLTTTGTSGPATLVGSTLNIPNYTTDLSGYVTLATDQTITGLKTIQRVGNSIDVLNFKIDSSNLYALKVAYHQNELEDSGEATWSLESTFNNGSGTGLTTTPISFFRGVLVTGERLLSVSVNDNLLEYYANYPTGRYPIYAYNTGVQQFASSIIVGETTGVVNPATGAIADLPAGVVANFKGRVIGSNAVNNNEFATLGQVTSTSRAAISLTTTGTSGPATYSSVTGVLNIPEYQGGVTSFNTRTGAVTLTSLDVTTALGFNPVTDLRTLTINGETYDLTANRSWTVGVNPSAREIETFIATSGQTVFTVTGGYTVGLVDVFINGVRLTSSDYAATNGTTVVLTVGTMVGNIVDIIKYTSGLVNSISGTGTTNELAYFTASTTISSLTTATYPSLTELSYVKGVTSSIQTQLNGKQNALTNPVTGTGTTNYLPKFTGASTIGNSIVYDDGVVGIGTLSATAINNASGIANLVVGNGGASSQGITIYTNSSTFGGLNFADATTGGGAYAGYIKFDHTNDSMGFFIGNNPRVTIFSDGNTFIGSSPSNNGARLQVSGTSILSGNVSIGTTYNGFALNVNGTAYVIGGDLYLSDGYTVRNASNNSSIAFNTNALSFIGAATFSSSVTSQVNNISADGAGVVLQGYVDNNLRIAVRGSGYNDGGRGSLIAQSGDFAGTLSVTGAATFSSNVGLNFTPSATGSNARALQLTNYGTLSGNGNIGSMSMASNAYESADNSWNRVNATSAGLYQISYTGQHTWSYTGASTAGSAISWTEAMRITSGGNVLIGTTTDAGGKLTIAGPQNTIGDIVIFNVPESNRASGTDNLRIYNDYQAPNYNITNDLGGVLQIGTRGGSPAFWSLNAKGGATFATSGGNVGIGTASPAVKFQINDGTNINLGIKVGQTDSTAVMLNAFNDGAAANIPLEFRATKFGFQLGNVLIGTTTDNGARLQVTNGNGISFSSRSGASNLFTYAAFGRTSDELAIGIAGAADQFFTGSVAGDAVIKALGTNNRILLGYGTATALTITSSNNVLIGTTTDDGQKLQVNGGFAIKQLKTQVFSGSVAAGSAGSTVTQRILRVTHSSATANMTLKVTLHFGISLGVTSNSSVQIIEGYLTVSDNTIYADSDWTTLGASTISTNFPSGVVMSGTSVFISDFTSSSTDLSFQATVNGSQNPGYSYYWYAKIEYISGGNAVVSP